MKKVITVIVVLLCFAAGFGAYYYKTDYSITNSSQWHSLNESEFSAKIPKTMEKGSSYSTSTGQQGIASYSNSKAAFSVSKISYSQNEALKDMDLKEYLSNLKINGQKLTPVAINDGYYAAYTKTSKDFFNEDTEIYMVEAMYQGDDALYSVTVCCRLSDRKKYESSMMEWLDSFKLK